MPTQPAQQPQQPQHPRPWWKDIRLGILLLVLIFGSAGIVIYMQKTPDRKHSRASSRPTQPKAKADGCNIEGILSAQDGPATVINGNIYSMGNTVCGGTITRITADSVTIESQGREQVFSMNVPAALTAIEKTKIQTQKNMEILSKAAENTFAPPKEDPAAVQPNPGTPQKSPTAESKPESKAPKAAASKSAKTKKVEIFITDWCPYCRQLESFLKSKKIAYERYDIEKNFAGKKKYKSLGGESVPLVLIGSKVIKGFDPDAIQAELEK